MQPTQKAARLICSVRFGETQNYASTRPARVRTRRSTLMIRLGVFIILTIFLLVFTLLRPHRHRFYRFLAFESFLGVVFMNAPDWFRDPYSLTQLASWFFLVCSLLLAIHGFRLLRTVGTPDNDIENTTNLVSVGAYRYIRHPLYCTLLLGGLGAILKRPTWLGFLILSILAGFVYATAKVEELENIERFGETYREYMKRTKMFIPYLL
jgi:protein-S-isoprenylcysteine O-methyltransferase Ste14